MSHHDHQSIDDARWQAQERARLAVRAGRADADAIDLRIARALREPPPVELPADFATTVARSAAARAAAMAQAPAVTDSRLEQRLLRALAVVFALSAAVVVAWFGRGWVAALAASLPGGQGALGWVALAACCLLGNGAMGVLRRAFGRGAQAAA